MGLVVIVIILIPNHNVKLPQVLLKITQLKLPENVTRKKSVQSFIFMQF